MFPYLNRVLTIYALCTEVVPLTALNLCLVGIPGIRSAGFIRVRPGCVCTFSKATAIAIMTLKQVEEALAWLAIGGLGLLSAA
jgi:hypothetical protein